MAASTRRARPPPKAAPIYTKNHGHARLAGRIDLLRDHLHLDRRHGRRERTDLPPAPVRDPGVPRPQVLARRVALVRVGGGRGVVPVFSRVFYEYYLIPVGVIFTLMVIFMPQGLLGVFRRQLNR